MSAKRRNHLGGNFCGHDPAFPKLSLAKPVVNNAPLLLRKASERIQKYFERPGLFPSLNMANGSDRQQRSERREACVVVLQAMLKFTDLASLYVGIPKFEDQKEVINFIAIKTLADHAGIGLRRTERALEDLNTSGLISTKQRINKDKSGAYKSLVAIRQFSKSFFGALGLQKMLDYEVKKRLHKEEKKQSGSNKKATLTQKHRNRLNTKSILNKLKKGLKFNRATNKAKGPPD